MSSQAHKKQDSNIEPIRNSAAKPSPGHKLTQQLDRQKKAATKVVSIIDQRRSGMQSSGLVADWLRR